MSCMACHSTSTRVFIVAKTRSNQNKGFQANFLCNQFEIDEPGVERDENCHPLISELCCYRKPVTKTKDFLTKTP